MTRSMSYTQPSRPGMVATLSPFIYTRRSGDEDADMAADYVELARKSWPHLVKVAKGELPSEFLGKGKITYGELCEKIDLPREYYRPAAASYFLGIIQEYCQRQGLPPLQAVAVNKATGFPGKGYDATSRNGKGYEQALKAVYEYPWPEKPPLLILEEKIRRRRVFIRNLNRKLFYIQLVTLTLLLISAWWLYMP